MNGKFRKETGLKQNKCMSWFDSMVVPGDFDKSSFNGDVGPWPSTTDLV